MKLWQQTVLEGDQLHPYLYSRPHICFQRSSCTVPNWRVAKAPIHCGRAPFTQCPVDRRSIISVRGSFQRPQQSPLWHRTIHMLFANVGIKSDSASASASTFGLESSGTLPWAPAWQTACSTTSRLYGHWSTVAASRCEAEVVVSTRQGFSALWGSYWTPECPKFWTRHRGPIEWSHLSPDLTPMEFISVRTPEGAYLCSPSQDCRRTLGKISSISDNGRCKMLRHVRVNAARRPDVCLQTDRGRFEHITTSGPRFDDLMFIFKTKGHRKYVVQ
jgi:hypothetical protein